MQGPHRSPPWEVLGTRRGAPGGSRACSGDMMGLGIQAPGGIVALMLLNGSCSQVQVLLL